MTIQEFSFGNFRSFKDIQTLNLTASKIKSKYAKIDEDNVMTENGQNFLKSKAIYGANAGGKSNVIKAFVTFIRIVRDSVKDDKVTELVDPFRLSTETEEEPSFFQLVFWHDDIKYRYGFELDSEIIHAEWLYATPGERELPYFIRDNQKIIDLDKTNFLEGHKLMTLFEDSDENDIFRNNSLFLSSLASLGFGKLSKGLAKAITSIFIVNGLGHSGMYQYAGNALEDITRKKYIVDFLKLSDFGIEDIDTLDLSKGELPNSMAEEIKHIPEKDTKRRLLISLRKKFNEKLESVGNEAFSLRLHESEGTKKLFELSPLIYEALTENRPIVIDEFDARFHALLTKRILELFNSSSNVGSQLIFTTHDTNLLSADLLRRDQIEFVEKDKFGASHLHSLVQYKGIRNTASFEKDYIQGKYGAIPFLGDFKKLIDSEIDA